MTSTGTARSHKRRLRRVALAALAATTLLATAVGVGATGQGSTAGAASSPPVMTVQSYVTPLPAGDPLYVEGSGCVSTTGPTAVLISLDTPSGEAIASDVVPTYSEAYQVAQGQWYGEVTVPIAALPASDYVVTASCNAQSQLFTYTPVTVPIGAATTNVLTIGTGALSPGASTTVSGSNCTEPVGVPGPVSVEAVLVNDESLPVAVSAVVPAANGAWSTSLTVPTTAPPGVYLVTADCDQYESGEIYLAQSVSIQEPPVSPATTVARVRGVTTAASGTQVTLSASVKSGGVGVAGVPVTLGLGTSTVVATTNPSGIARGVVTAPAAGTVPESATFAGTSGFASSTSGSVPFTVTGSQSATTLAFQGVHTVDEFSPAALSAKLTGPGGVAVVGRDVTFSTGDGYFESAVTNSSGVATIDSSLSTTGTDDVGIVYNGNADPTFASSTVTGLVTVDPPFTPEAIACATASKCTIVGGGGATRYTTDGGQTWTAAKAVTTQSLDSVACPSTTLCVAVGADGAVLTSTTEGASWKLRPASTVQTLDVVKCTGATTCIAVGTDGVVLTSTNSGTTWAAGASGTTLAFDALSCPTTTDCVATANGPSGSASLDSTTSGATWTVAGASEPDGPVVGQNRLWCTSVHNCLESTSDGYLYRTTDGGGLWVFDGGVLGGTLWCRSATVCLSVGDYGATATSHDGGGTWTVTQPFYPEGTVQDMACVGGQCTAVVQGYSSDATTWSTADFGSVWTGPVGL